MEDVSRHLRELVRKHKVCWEIWPVHYIDRKGKNIKIGFEVDLLGVQPVHTYDPGDDKCLKVHEDLNTIAASIMPGKECGARCETGSFDASIHFSGKGRFRGEITTPIYALYSGCFDRPTDTCQIESINEMEGKLEELGAQKDTWWVQIRDKSGNLSQPAIFPLTIKNEATQETPPQGVFREQDLGPMVAPKGLGSWIPRLATYDDSNAPDPSSVSPPPNSAPGRRK